MLKGNWPASIPDRLKTDLASMSPSANPSEAMRRARHAIVGEGLFALDAGAVVEKARALKPVKRFAMLAGWVLPSPDHPLVRLEGDFSPSYPAPPGSEQGGDLPHTGHRAGQHRQGARQARRAGRAGRDAEGHGRRPGASSERGRLAMLAMIAAARGDDPLAGGSLAALRPLVEKLPLDLDNWARWPELVAADRAVLRPALRQPAAALADVLSNRAEKKPATEASNRLPSTLWEVQVKHLRARADRQPVAGGVSPWKDVAQTTARSRRRGRSIAALVVP